MVDWNVKYDVPSGAAAAICGCSDKELWSVRGKLEKEREDGKVKLGDCGLRCKFKV